MNKIDTKLDAARKLKEYEMKITKMAGNLSDYHIDRAIESDDFSIISSFLIDYFSGTIGKTVDVGYLISKYKEYGLNDRVEDVDFNIDEWYKVKYEIDNDYSSNLDTMSDMTEKEYIEHLIKKRNDDDC